MSEIAYNPACSICRDLAGKNRAGVQDRQLCIAHLRTEHDRLTSCVSELEAKYEECFTDLTGMVGDMKIENDQLRASHAALVEAAEKSNKIFCKMLHHFDGNLDYPKEYRKYIEQLSSKLEAALAEVKG